MRRHFIVASVAAAALVAFAAPGVQAQGYPEKPITLIVPWPAGGSTDVAMRTIAECAAKQLGQPIIVDNKPGASGTLGPAIMAANAKPDGYTIAQMPITVMRLPLMQKTTWDAVNDFTYIAHLTGYTFGITTKAEGQFKTWKDVVDLRQGQPRQGHLRHAGRRHFAAHRHGADRGRRGHPAHARAIQGRRRDQRRGARRAYDAAGRLRRAGSRWSTAASCGCSPFGRPSAARTGRMRRR